MENKGEEVGVYISSESGITCSIYAPAAACIPNREGDAGIELQLEMLYGGAAGGNDPEGGLCRDVKLPG